MIAIDDFSCAHPGGDFRFTIPHLALAPGERVAVVGPGGTDKTTLLNPVAAIAVPRVGTVRLGEAVILEMTDRDRRALRGAGIGVVFRDFALLDHLSARENILDPARVTGGTRPDGSLRPRVENLASACGLSGRLDRRPGVLIQGEQQRVALCRALILRPKLILADEATGILDPENKTAIRGLLFARVAEAEATLFAVTHDHDLLPRFDRVTDFARFRDRKAGS